MATSRSVSCLPAEHGRAEELLEPRLESILCVVDRKALDGSALQRAISHAVSHEACLTLLAVATPALGFIALAGLDPEAVSKEIVQEKHALLLDALKRVPWHLKVVTLLRTGRSVPTIASEARNHDLVVAEGRLGRRRWPTRTGLQVTFEQLARARVAQA